MTIDLLDSGLNLLFQEGIHYEAFSDEKELLDKIHYYESNPKKAIEIAKNSYNRYWKYYSQKSLVKDLMKRIFLGNKTSCYSYREEKLVQSRLLRAYQSIQEIHRISSKVELYYDYSDLVMNLIEYASDYQRLSFHSLDTISEFYSCKKDFFGKPITHTLYDVTASQLSIEKAIREGADFDYLVATQPGPQALNQLSPNLSRRFYFEKNVDCWIKAQ